MKIKPLKLLGKAIQFAAPVVVGLVVDPVAGGAAVAASLGAAGFKRAGQALEKMGLGRPHKVVSPVAAVGIPGAIVALAGAVGVDQPFGPTTGLLAQLDAMGVPPWLAIGLFLWVMHQSGNNVENSGNRK